MHQIISSTFTALVVKIMVGDSVSIKVILLQLSVRTQSVTYICSYYWRYVWVYQGLQSDFGSLCCRWIFFDSFMEGRLQIESVILDVRFWVKKQITKAFYSNGKEYKTWYIDILDTSARARFAIDLSKLDNNQRRK